MTRKGLAGSSATAAALVAALASAAALAGAACGGPSAKVLERLDGATPPGSTPRVDVFLLRSVATCAVGRACTAGDSSQCFYVADSTGPRISFSTDGLRFVRPGDPLVQTADRAQCFRLVMEDTMVGTVRDLLASFRASVFQSSGGNVDLDLRIHEVPSLEGGFIRYYTGLFLPPAALEAAGLPLLGRDTDSVFAISGYRDPETTLQPKVEYCTGTNWLGQGVLGASPYTWMTMNERCVRSADPMVGAFLIQAFFGMRDLGGVNNPSQYPACGRATRDPHTWFPWPDDCRTDPDAPACGQSTCDPAAFFAHILAAHWPRDVPYNGNYCADGRMNYDETGVDSGGICDLIGQ